MTYVKVQSNWLDSWTTMHDITRNENLCLIQYKVTTRVNYTQDKINNFNKHVSRHCIECKINSDSIIHAFWECNKIKSVWAELQHWLTETLHIYTWQLKTNKINCVKKKKKKLPCSTEKTNVIMYTDISGQLRSDKFVA